MQKKITYFLVLFVVLASCRKNSNENNLVFIESSNSEKIAVANPIPLELIEKLDDSVKLYYRKFNNYEIWINSKNRKALIEEIKSSYLEGLNPKDYSITEIEKLEQSKDSLDKNASINYDITLTKAYKKLGFHLYKGKLDPKTIYEDWDLNKENPSLSDTLFKAIKNKTISNSLDNLKPKDFTYRKIKESLRKLKELPDDNFQPIVIENKIELNDTLPEMISIKERLIYWNDYQRKDSILTAVYDNYTFEVIKKFQTRHGLVPDGVIGKGTIKALNFSKNDRIKQAIVNLERWKWFPYDFGNEYFIVNIPNYSLDYVKNNDTIAKHRLVVGRKARKTPILTSKISNLVINPTWTVPPTIIKEDLTPSATKNIDYFERNEMSIFDAKGNSIAPEEWNPELAKSYRYVQSPGVNNSLGLIKFNFKNKFSVYLHDTNHKNYFSRENRALSSGCVRVENPLDLSKKLIQEESTSSDKEVIIDSVLKTKKTRIIPIQHSVNVYLFYWTNWVEDNQLNFREDIYNLDKELYSLLGN